MLISKAEGLNHHGLEIMRYYFPVDISKVWLTSAPEYVHVIAMETFQGDHLPWKKALQKANASFSSNSEVLRGI